MRRNVVGCKIALSTTPGVASKCLDGDLSDSSAVAPRRGRDAGLHALEPRSNAENTSTHAHASGV